MMALLASSSEAPAAYTCAWECGSDVEIPIVIRLLVTS
jgi:hypothetical protein